MCWSADASDILIQRLKAVHMSVTDGSWNRADHMELVPPDTVQMTSEVEEDMANQEQKARIERNSLGKGYGKQKGDWSKGKDKKGKPHGKDFYRWIPRGKGKGKNKEKSGKGEGK